jgi:hypothetical protein
MPGKDDYLVPSQMVGVTGAQNRRRMVSGVHQQRLLRLRYLLMTSPRPFPSGGW